VADTEVIARCWTDGDNIGVGCKANGLLVVDLDRHHADADGIEAFRALCAEQRQEWPGTLTVRTPSGGLHLYFRAPRERALGNSSGKLGAGIDTRGPGKGSNGGYVVAPGSVVDGTPYTIARDIPIRDLPGWIVELLDPPTVVRPMKRITVTTSRYALTALQGEVQRILDAPVGEKGKPGRNDQLNRSAYALGQMVAAGLIGQETVEQALRAAAEAVGLMNDDGERQVEATIRSGLTAGFRKPRQVRAGAR
jgi:hypothetical protein